MSFFQVGRGMALVFALMVATNVSSCVGTGEEITTISQPIVGGIAVNSSRFEVGLLQSGCAGVMVGPRYLLTAAHCLANPTTSVTQVGGTFTIDGQSAVSVDRYVSLGSIANVYDIAVARLVSPISSAIATPSRIAGILPSNGTTMNVLGYGCTNRTTQLGAGTKRTQGFLFGAGTDLLCEGDSGGPVYQGYLSDNGPLVQLNSGYAGSSSSDFFADVTLSRLRIEEMILSWEGGYEPGMDRYGFDFASSWASDAAACRDLCSRNGACKVFTFVPSSNICYLKSAAAIPASNPAVTSGAPANIGIYDLAGSDYSSFYTATDEACETACMTDSSCRAFTRNTSNGVCYLKNAVPTASTCSTCRSGIRRAFDINIDRPGGDYSNAAASNVAVCARRCELDGRCQAFSYVASTTQCWLKDRPGNPVATSGVTSAVRRGMEVNVNRSGSDFQQITQTFPNPFECQAACENNSSCVAWTLAVYPLGSPNTCWLKNAVPSPTTSSWGLVSGRRGAAFF